jgi:hypothetical protein
MRSMTRTLPSLAMVGVLALVGCGAASPAPSGSVSASPSAGAAPADDCQAIDLVSPAGDRLDLTGTWQGGVMVHHIRQFNECVWWIAYSTWPGTELGDIGNLVFFGRLASDFTLSGRFMPIVMNDQADTYGLPGQGRSLVFQIVFDDTGRATTLVRDAPRQHEPPLQYFDELTFVGPLPEPAGPPQQ